MQGERDIADTFTVADGLDGQELAIVRLEGIIRAGREVLHRAAGHHRDDLAHLGLRRAHRAYNGYTLFGARGGTYLIDMEGLVVRTWSKVRTNPRFLDNGNILDSSTDDPSRGGGFVEVDWNDNVVWRYTETRADYAPHHDFRRRHSMTRRTLSVGPQRVQGWFQPE